MTYQQRADRLRAFIKEVDNAKTIDDIMALWERMCILMSTYVTPEDLI
jgi:hypothetical protein